jgi:hypothetical protein
MPDVDRHGDGAQAAMPDRSSRGGIAGILAPDVIAGFEDRAQHDPQCVLCSRRQHDLVRIAAQPARRQQMIGNRGAQLTAAPGVAVCEVLGAEGTHAPAGKRPEALQRPFIDMRAAERQRPCCGASIAILVLRASLTRAGIRGRRRRCRSLWWRPQSRPRSAAHRPR